MARKQALSGLMFAAISDYNVRPTDIEHHQDEFQYLLIQWMGEKVRIERRSTKLDADVASLVKWLSENGFEGCLLKGQGNALLYQHPSLRTSGDIDIWVRPRERTTWNDDIKRTIDFAKAHWPEARAIYHHIDDLEWDGTPVEIHYRPRFMLNRINDAHLQRYFQLEADRQFQNFRIIGGAPVAVPVPSFNIIIQISHIFGHLLMEGIGLRQMVDCFYTLKSYRETDQESSIDWKKRLHHLGLYRIAQSIMWILIEWLGMNPQWAIVTPDAHRGKYVLNEILLSGNLGHFDGRNAKFGTTKIGRNTQRMVRDCRLVRYFPSEALSEPFFRLWHAWWRLRHNCK